MKPDNQRRVDEAHVIIVTSSPKSESTSVEFLRVQPKLFGGLLLLVYICTSEKPPFLAYAVAHVPGVKFYPKTVYTFMLTDLPSGLTRTARKSASGTTTC